MATGGRPGELAVQESSSSLVSREHSLGGSPGSSPSSGDPDMLDLGMLAERTEAYRAKNEFLALENEMFSRYLKVGVRMYVCMCVCMCGSAFVCVGMYVCIHE